LASQTKGSGGRGKLVLMIVAVLVLVVGGVGGWWWYAQGQVLFLHKQMKWAWGTDLVNYKVESDLSFDVSIKRLATNPSTELQNNNFSGGDQYYGVNDLLAEGIDISGRPGDNIPSDLQFKMQIKSEQYTVGKNTEGYSDLSLSSTGGGYGDSNFDLKTLVNDKKIAGKYFFQLETLDLGQAAELVDSFGVDLDKIIGTWLSFDLSQIPGGSEDLNNDDYQKKLVQKSNEFWNKVKDKGYFTIRDPHQTMTIESDTLKRIDYVLKPETTDALLEEFRIFLQTISVDQQNLAKNYDEWKADEPEQYQQIKDVLNNISYSLWINTDTKVIQGIEWSGQNLKFGYQKIQTDAIISFNAKIILAPTEPYEIKAPANSQDVIKFFESFMVPPISREDETANLDLDSDGLIGAEEAYYGSDPLVEDTDKDGYFDGEEVANGYNPNGPGQLAAPLYQDYQMDLFQQACVSVGGTWSDPKDTVCLCPDNTKINVSRFSNFSELAGDDLCKDFYPDYPPLMNDARINPLTACDDGGGTWVGVERKAPEQCSPYTNWDACEEVDGCDWDSFAEPQLCIPAWSYCQCPNSLKVFEDFVGLGFRCQ